ncbi:MAG TPA: fibronectin type III domain-containing protein, partial [Variovorax sp.]
MKAETKGADPAGSDADHDPAGATISRRGFFKGAGAAGLAAAASPFGLAASPAPAAADGTPQQIHLTWGNDSCTSVFVSWVSPAQAVNPRVRFRHSSASERTAPAVQRTYTDGLNGQTVFTYHAQLDRLPPDETILYTVTVDNASQDGQPFTAAFQTAPTGRKAFRWTSYGDLATPV